jgi:hypothetical protein
VLVTSESRRGLARVLRSLVGRVNAKDESRYSLMSYLFNIVSDEYARPPNYRGEEDEGGLIWQTPLTVWEPTPEGPIARVAAHTTWQYLCLLLALERVERLRKCENPDCPAPYFIARRKDRMFCSEDCAHLIAARRLVDKER